MAKEPDHSPFPATRWTVVLRVRASGDETSAHNALSQLCTDYWYPLYVYARRRGWDPEDAKDITQGFFEYALVRNLFASAQPAMGRMRTFLLTAFERYMGDEQKRVERLKRGGTCEFIPFDCGEARYAVEPLDVATPARLFERAWALTVLDGAVRKLADEEEKAGRIETYRALETLLLGDDADAEGYREAAAKLGLGGEAVRQAVARLRRRFREILRGRVADTLHNPTQSEVDAELAELRKALRAAVD